jgi:putative ABC transport system permease protein
MKKVIRIIKSVKRMIFLYPMRVILSLSGIAVGIASVIIIVSLSEGARTKMLTQIEAMGSNVITIDAGLVKEATGRKRQAFKMPSLKEKDAALIATECLSIIAIAPTQEKPMLMKYGEASVTGRVIGTTSSYPLIRNFSIASGRFISEDDNRLSLRAVVIGQKCNEYLFHGSNPVGEIVKINNIPFEVVGVLNAKGASYDGANEDDMVFIPLNTGMRRVFNVDYIKNIFVQASSKEKIPKIEKQIRSILRERHRLREQNKEDDFIIQNVYTAIRVENETNRSFTFLISSVAILSLLVGGVGILATMLLSIKERKPEIGLRMAVGARINDIVLQFLLEAVILSLTGGLAGILAGTTGAYMIGIFSDFNINISYRAAIISFIISIILGIFFGSYPAKKASAMEPVRALAD